MNADERPPDSLPEHTRRDRFAGAPLQTLVFFALLLGLFFVVRSGRQDSEAEAAASVESFSGPTMGTKYRVSYADNSCDAGPPTFKAYADARLAEINRRMSTYDADSELSQFNASDSTDWFPVSQETARVVAFALEVSEESGGAFDPTVGPVVNLWGFGPDGRREEPPTDEEVSAALGRVGHQKVEARLDPPALRKAAPGVYLDLSAVAKGYASDAIGELMAENGVEDFMVEIGGEIVCRGAKPDGSAWRIGVEKPITTDRVEQAVFELLDKAIASSGDYRNFFESGGRRYSHTIDPATGRPVRHNLASVSVLADSCMEADAVATALLVMGPGRGYDWAEERGIAALLIQRVGGGRFQVRATPAWEEATAPTEAATP